MMLRFIRLEHGTELAVIGDFVLHAVKLVMEGKDNCGQSHDDMERQTENAEHIVHVEPHPFEILPDSQGEEVLCEPR